MPHVHSGECLPREPNEQASQEEGPSSSRSLQSSENASEIDADPDTGSESDEEDDFGLRDIDGVDGLDEVERQQLELANEYGEQVLTLTETELEIALNAPVGSQGTSEVTDGGLSGVGMNAECQMDISAFEKYKERLSRPLVFPRKRTVSEGTSASTSNGSGWTDTDADTSYMTKQAKRTRVTADQRALVEAQNVSLQQQRQREPPRSSGQSTTTRPSRNSKKTDTKGLSIIDRVAMAMDAIETDSALVGDDEEEDEEDEDTQPRDMDVDNHERPYSRASSVASLGLSALEMDE